VPSDDVCWHQLAVNNAHDDEVTVIAIPEPVLAGHPVGPRANGAICIGCGETLYENETTYARREQLFADDGIVWDADTGALEGHYKGVVGAATAQQIVRKNTEAWRSFFTWLKGPDQNARPPVYWGNEDDGRDLRSCIRCDEYTLEWGARSRLEIPFGMDLKNEFGLNRTERLRLEVSGEPRWAGKQGRLEIAYDEVDDTFRAFQPVTVDDSQLEIPLADSSEAAALDIGVNNLVACTTTTGHQYLYEGRDLFAEFREATERMAYYQSKLDDRRRTSRRIDRLYRKRTRSRITHKIRLFEISSNDSPRRTSGWCALANCRICFRPTGRAE